MISLINENGIDDKTLKKILAESLEGKRLKRVLLIPPDFTRMYSYGGRIAAIYYELLRKVAEIDIMPALGTHEPMTQDECEAFFEGKIPYEKLTVHNWRTGVKRLGEVPADFVFEASEGIVNESIAVEVSNRITDGGYDLIISIGQVVPHEVVGMANYSKNIFVGCGGSSMINSSHMLGAFYGLERMMGRDHSPVRRVFDYAEDKFLRKYPIMYVLTVAVNDELGNRLEGIFIENDVFNRGRESFEMAVELAQKTNIIKVKKPIKKAIVYLEPKEFKSTWLGNKAIYRTRMAIANGGELIIIAPGIKKFGEDALNDRLIRKYGYVGRLSVLELARQNEELNANMSVAAHLIHGSSDGRFKIVYAAPQLGRESVEAVGYEYADIDEITEKYSPERLQDGINILPDGEEIFYISNPALGLWQTE